MWTINQYRSSQWLCFSGHCVLQVQPRFERLASWYAANNHTIELDRYQLAFIQQDCYQLRPSDVYHILLGYALANGYQAWSK